VTLDRLIEDCSVALYCDMHAHSRKHNIFIYGCENMKRHPDRRLLEQVFPLMLHKNVADKFSFENCKFRVQKNKEGTGRIVVWMLGVTNSYTLEASFAGSTLGSRNGTHFSTVVSPSLALDLMTFGDIQKLFFPSRCDRITSI
jgi:cytosolic carboxypeptidase protein 2/3